MRYLLPLLLLITALLGGCAAPPTLPEEAYSRPVEKPVAEAIPIGKHYLIDTARSDIRIVTYPEGRFGHAHVIGGVALSGKVVVPENHHQVWLDLAIQIDALQVDEPSWRTDEGFASEMSAKAIAGTRDNMLKHVLHSDQYPQIHIRANQASGPFWQPDIKAQITLAGQTRELTVPVFVSQTDDELVVTGRLRIRQSEFGIEPFSALGGIVKVADEVLIRFRIYAHLAP